jgi:type IV pilus assembly protein PilP
MRTRVVGGFRIASLLACLVAAPAACADVAREVGEYFELATLHFVGFGGLTQPHAILASDCGVEIPVVVGSYVGKNDGRIVRYDERELVVVELVADGDGGWREREIHLSREPRANAEAPRLPPPVKKSAQGSP